MQPSRIAPAPWFLTGNGFVLLYHLPAAFNHQFGFMADYQKAGYKGGIGAVMLVDYKSSDVGPYYELLYIPGLFYIGGKLTFSISKIYVSSYDSLWNARENWAIPKELAQFKVTTLPDGSHRFQASQQDHQFLEVALKPKGWQIPFTSKLLPLSRITQQNHLGDLLLTPITLKGQVRFCSSEVKFSEPDFFPPIHQLKPIVTLTIQDFSMIFPVAEKL